LNGWKGGHSQMKQAEEAALCAWLEERFCRSTVEIRAHISAEFGPEYSHSGCIKLLARLGFEYRKPKPLPRVASAEKQTAFIALYEKLMRELPADEAVYFADAVHPEYNSPLTKSVSSDSICSSSFMRKLTDVDEATVCGSGRPYRGVV
jgi:hypothetical protein